MNKRTEERGTVVEQLVLMPPVYPQSRQEMVPLDQLPATYIGPRPTADLLASVKLIGVMEPIIVWRGSTDTLVILGGRRRTEAARRALAEAAPEERQRYDRIKAVVYEGITLAQAMALILTLHATRRENEAMALHAVDDLISAGANQQEICVATGLAPIQIRALLHRKNLVPELRLAWEHGVLSARVADAAAKLPVQLQRPLVEKVLGGEHVTADDVRAARMVQSTDAVASLPGLIFETPSSTDGEDATPRDSASVIQIAEIIEAYYEADEEQAAMPGFAAEMLAKIADILPPDLRPPNRQQL